MNNKATMINSPVRTVKAKVESFNGSTLENTYSYNDALISVNVDRVGDESKFFGFGICQKTNIKLRDVDRKINITTANSFKLYFNSNNQNEYISNYPIFYVSETHRDENTNQLSITAYDALYGAEKRTVAELGLESYTVREFAQACADLIGAAGIEIIGLADTETCFDTSYESGANFEGSESIRAALNAVAEITQTIYYLNSDNVLIFKRLDISGQPVLTIGKADYITLDSGENRRLTRVCHATELGDNVEGGLRKAASGEAVRLDNVSPEAHEIKTQVKSKNIFDLSKSLLGDLTNISIWAGIVLETEQVKAMFKPNTTYTAQFVAECIAEIGGFTSIFDAHLGFMLHNPITKQSVAVCGLYRSNTTTVLHSGDVVEASNTFTTPINLDNYKLLAYTQRCLNGETPVLNTIRFTNIQIEEGNEKTAYTPCISDLTQVSVTQCGKNLAPKLQTTAINQGVTFTPVDKGGIAVSGTPSGVAVCTLATIKPIVTSGKIALSLTGDFYNIVPDFKMLNSAGHTVAQIQTGRTQIIDLDLYPDVATWIIAIKREANNVAVSGTVYLQIELGDEATAYEPYNALNYAPEADGTVEGVTSISPTTTLYSGSEGVLISAEYYLENSVSGTTQYIRNNPFWDMREDIADLVDNALAAVRMLTINQFDCSWRGNYLLEVGDKIALVTKDDKEVYSYVINDSIFYSGGLEETTSWSYSNNETETASNPSSLGDVLNQTSAKVDKANKEIELVVSDTAINSEAISSLQMNTNSITASVKQLKDDTQSTIEGINENINTLSSQVELAMTSEEVTIAIQTELEDGVEKVVTRTNKFTFDDTGLSITKSDSDISTQITENGMTVYKNSEAVLEANKDGVKAVDLHATTYLIIGTNSRFEDYATNRTGCFWIGE